MKCVIEFVTGNGGCVDNDDGSSFYNITFNFFVFGGHKSDFNGHSKRSWGNINVYVSPFCLMRTW